MKWFTLLLLLIPSIAIADFGRDPLLLEGSWHYVQPVDREVDPEIYQLIEQSMIEAKTKLKVTATLPPYDIVFASSTYISWMYKVLLGIDVTLFALYFDNTIYLPYSFDSNDLWEQSQGFHEAVHHVQVGTQRWMHLYSTNPSCFYAVREAEAMRLQASWLLSRSAEHEDILMVGKLRVNAIMFVSHCGSPTP